MNEVKYKDIKGNPIKVGDVVVSWCTGKDNKHSKPVKIGDLLALDYVYVNSWGMLEIRNDLETNDVICIG